MAARRIEIDELACLEDIARGQDPPLALFRQAAMMAPAGSTRAAVALGSVNPATSPRAARKRHRHRNQKARIPKRNVRLRDSGLNPEHLDFQGREVGALTGTNTLQISPFWEGQAAIRYPWFGVVPAGLRT
jgi:hypothetical protein